MIALFSIAISGLFDSHSVEATVITTVTGSGSAVPVLIDSGDFACSTSPGPIGSASYELHFAATQAAKNVSGVWYIAVFDETAGHILSGEQHGIFTRGTIDSARFNLTGEITFDNVCSNPVPTFVTITGQCGWLTSPTPNVELRAGSGERGSFLATVFCSP